MTNRKQILNLLLTKTIEGKLKWYENDRNMKTKFHWNSYAIIATAGYVAGYYITVQLRNNSNMQTLYETQYVIWPFGLAAQLVRAINNNFHKSSNDELVVKALKELE